MGQGLLKAIQPISDKTILKALDPRSKLLDPESKSRLKAILEAKESGIWDRRKVRWRESRASKVAEADTKTA